MSEAEKVMVAPVQAPPDGRGGLPEATAVLAVAVMLPVVVMVPSEPTVAVMLAPNW